MQKMIFFNRHALILFLAIVALLIADSMYAQMTNFGNLYINASGSISVNGSFVNIGSSTDVNNSGSLQLTGDFTNNGNDLNSAGTGTVTFSGAANQSINGTQSTTFYNLTKTNTGNAVIAGDQTIKNNLTLTAGSFLLNDHVLTVSGGITHASGGLSSTPLSGLVLNGAAVKNLYFDAAGNTIKNVTISSTATSVNLDDSLNITAGTAPGTLTVDGTFNTTDYLTLKSDISGTSMVASSAGAINGNVTVERYIATGTGSAPNHGKSWQLLATPTQGQTIKDAWQEGAIVSDLSSPTPGSPGNPHPGYGTMLTGGQANAVAQGFDVYTSNGPSVKIYNSTTNGYDGPANTGSTPIYNQKGYFVFVRGDRSVVTSTGTANPTILRTKGTLFTADPSHLPPVTNVAANIFESVGNPYAAPLDLRQISKSANVKAFFQVWDPRAGGLYNLGAFQTLYREGTDYKVTPGGGSYGPFGTVNNYIQSGQAFLVQTTSNGAGTVSFSENAKANVNTFTSLFTRSSGGNKTTLQSSLTTETGLAGMLRISLNFKNAADSAILLDGVLDQFDSSYNDNVDIMDALKPMNGGENLCIKRGDKLLAIERRQQPGDGDTIFLALTNERIQQYHFQFEAANLTNGLQVFLEDTYLGTKTPVNTSGTTDASFSIENIADSYAPDRFRIVFNRVTVVPVTFTSVKAYLKDKNIDVEWRVNNEININQYEVEKSVDGINFTTISVAKPRDNNGGAAVYVVVDANPAIGYNYYRIRSVDIDGTMSYTSIVKVSIEDLNEDITIYPNPVINGQIHLQLINQPEGDYGIRLLDKLGQVIFTKKIVHSTGNSTELIKPSFNIAHGVYEMEITKPNGKAKNIEVLY